MKILSVLEYKSIKLSDFGVGHKIQVTLLALYIMSSQRICFEHCPQNTIACENYTHLLPELLYKPLVFPLPRPSIGTRDSVRGQLVLVVTLLSLKVIEFSCWTVFEFTHTYMGSICHLKVEDYMRLLCAWVCCSNEEACLYAQRNDHRSLNDEILILLTRVI